MRPIVLICLFDFNDILARKIDGSSQFQNPSFFALFSSKKEFEKYTILFNYGFGTGKIGRDKQVTDFTKAEEFTINPIITIELHDTTQEKLKEWGYPEAKLLPVPT